MRLQQRNKDNQEGFYRKEHTDFGLDSSGNLAPGYQHHDGLWFPGSDEKYNIKPKKDVTECVTFFTKCFKDFVANSIDAFGTKSSLDLGCGSGILSHLFKEKGVLTASVDANRIAAKDSPYLDCNHFIARTDERLDITDSEGNRVKFDLITSFDHLEHIEDKRVNVFMSNVKEHLSEDGVFVFIFHPFAYEGDQAHVHCNTGDRPYWIKKLEENGLVEIPAPFVIGRSGQSSHEIFAKLK